MEYGRRGDRFLGVNVLDAKAFCVHDLGVGDDADGEAGEFVRLDDVVGDWYKVAVEFVPNLAFDDVFVGCVHNLFLRFSLCDSGRRKNYTASIGKSQILAGSAATAIQHRLKQPCE